MDFSELYKNIIESAEEEPPARVWDEIQNELDVDLVWNNIEKNLSGARKRRRLYPFAAAASILLLIGTGIFFHSNLKDQEFGELIISIDRTDDTFSNDALIQEPAIQPALSSKREFTEIPETNGSVTEQALPDIDTPGQFYGHYEDMPPLPKPESNPQLSGHSIKSGIHEIAGKRENIPPGNKAVIASGYYAGLSGHLANTWLLNNKTIQGLRSDELTASLPSFGYNFGFIAGKDVSRRLGIQAEVHLVSTTRQNYNEYMHGQYINNNMKFSYSSFALSGRWYFINGSNPGRHALIFGAYTGILRNAIQHLNGESLSLNNEYSSSDHGIIAGYEYFHPLGNKLELGSGFQVKYGLNNIFTGNEIIPGYLNNTRNASINIMLSVRYTL
jgi:hypothetical protein